MKKHIFIILAILPVLFSCNGLLREDKVEKYVEVAITATLDTTGINGTKTYMEDDTVNFVGKVKWSSEDYLMMYISNKEYKSANATQISDDGKNALFVFSISKNFISFYSGFPAYLYYGESIYLDIDLDEDNLPTFKVKLPADREHVGGRIFNDFQNIAFGTCTVANFKTESGSDPEKLSCSAACVMHNVFGILKVPVKISGGDSGDVRYIRLTDNTSGSYLAGTFDVNIGSNGIPTLIHNRDSGGESRTIEMKVPAAGQLAETNNYAYFLVPPGTLFGTNGFGLAVYTDNGYYGSKTIKPVTGQTLQIERSKIAQLDIQPFVKKPFITVDKSYSANCHVFSTEEKDNAGKVTGMCTFPAGYKGNGYQLIKYFGEEYQIPYNSDNYAEILWQSKMNGDVILAAEILDSPVYYNDLQKGPCISFHESGTPGNALIALKNASGEILWSWHIWIVTPVEKVKLDAGIGLGSSNNTVHIMDRNLGALYTDVSRYGSQTFGCAYQFGRKDPFLNARITNGSALNYNQFMSMYPDGAISADSLATNNFTFAKSIKNPTERVNDSNGKWCSEDVSWTYETNVIFNITVDSEHKRLCDPCPYGWRTIQESAITSMLGWTISGGNIVIGSPQGEVKSVNGSDAPFYFMFTGSSTPMIFPATGISTSSNSITRIGSAVGIWGASQATKQASTGAMPSQGKVLEIGLKKAGTNQSGQTETEKCYTSDIKALDMQATLPVRCVKYDESTGKISKGGN